MCFESNVRTILAGKQTSLLEQCNHSLVTLQFYIGHSI